MGFVVCCRQKAVLSALIVPVLLCLLCVSPPDSQAAPAANDARAMQLAAAVRTTFASSYNSSTPPWRTVMPSAANGRKQLLSQLNELARLTQTGAALSVEARTQVFAQLRAEVLTYPDLLRQSTAAGAAFALPNILFRPGMAQVRALVHATVRNARSDMPRDLLADAMGYSGTRRNLLLQHGIAVLDDNELDEAQLGAVDDLYDTLPAHLVRPPAFTVNKLLEVPDADWQSVTGASAGFNIDPAKIGAGNDEPFPPDVVQHPTSGFCAVLQHEQNHAIGALNIQTDPLLRNRESQLLARAGGDASQYLRSQFAGPDKNDVDKDGNRSEGFFQAAPQEFFASISNQYLSSTERTFELALKRFRAGKREPLNQFLFFASVYAQGNTTPFFSQDAPCDYSTQAVEIGRGPGGWVSRLTFNGSTYWFTIDAQGNVSNIRAGTVAMNGIRQLVYRAAALEANDVTISRQGADIVVSDPSGSAYPFAAPCRTVGSNVACPANAVDQVVVYAGDGDDSVKNGSGLSMIAFGGRGNDTLESGGATDALFGEDDQDRLFGGNGSDYLIGGAGGDRMDGGSGTDVDIFVGEAGTDTVDYSSRTRRVSVDLAAEFGGEEFAERDILASVENVLGGSGPDVLHGSSGRNQLEGGDGNDRLDGREGNDELMGEAGDDTLLADASGDWLRGGADVDTIDLSSQSTDITFDLGRPLVGQYGGNLLLDTDVENLIGGRGNDRLTGNGSSNNLIGGQGKDELRGAGGVDTADYSDHATGVQVTIDGSANDGSAGEQDNVFTDIENLRGGAGNDTLIGNGSSNNLIGGQGKDELRGAGGVDTADYSDHSTAVQVTIDGSANDGSAGEQDNVFTDVENLRGGAGNDQLYGSNGNNVIRGGDGEDWLDGGLGSDRLDGGAGIDTGSYLSRTSAVRVTLTDNEDAATGNDGQGCPGSGCEKDNVSTNNVVGGSGSDVLIGDLVPNVLVGCGGNDELTGGVGPDDELRDSADWICTGSGNDTFYAEDGGHGDLLDCGTGTDRYTADTWFDNVSVSCEQRLVP